MQFSVALAFLFSTLFLAPLVHAQPEPPTPGQTPATGPTSPSAELDAEEATGEEGNFLDEQAETEPKEQTHLQPDWQGAMQHYSMGDAETSLQELRALILECGEPNAEKCSKGGIATLYACVGIVLAGGKENHNGAVVAFRKSLVLEPKLMLLPEYQTPPVTAALQEARTGAPAPRQPIPASQYASSTQAQPAAELPYYDDTANGSSELDRIYLLMGVGAKGGIFSTGYADVGAGQLAGSLGILGTPAQTSGFALGARMRGGAYVGEGIPIGFMGAAAMLGGVFGPRKDDRFAFCTGGAGFEYWPAASAAVPAFHFHGGGSLGGFLIAGGVDIMLNEVFFGSFVGIEVGFGSGL